MNRFTTRVAAVALGALVALPAASQPATPKDPKSPIPDCVDGRGPTGPIEVKILSPKPGEVIHVPAAAVGQPPAKGASVEVKLEVKNWESFQDPKTKCGQGIAIIFDNGPAAIHYDPTKPWLYPKVPAGTHTLRAFPVRPWGEAVREAGAFALVTFSVGEKDGKNAPDPKAPLLTVNRPRTKIPKGQKVLLDFFVTGCVVAGKDVPDSCRVRYRVDELPEVILEKPDPVWLADLPVGRHAYVMGLTHEGKIVDGPFNLHQGTFEVVDTATPAPPAPAPAKAGAAP
ncbi:MAG TPA: hypothetical protein PLB02_03355 [Thermoanaerobaculia bacterium]|nr:hypothetical protein [Thermoanaerobaculia bacterium]